MARQPSGVVHRWAFGRDLKRLISCRGVSGSQSGNGLPFEGAGHPRVAERLRPCGRSHPIPWCLPAARRGAPMRRSRLRSQTAVAWHSSGARSVAVGPHLDPRLPDGWPNAARSEPSHSRSNSRPRRRPLGADLWHDSPCLCQRGGPLQGRAIQVRVSRRTVLSQATWRMVERSLANSLRAIPGHDQPPWVTQSTRGTAG